MIFFHFQPIALYDTEAFYSLLNELSFVLSFQMASKETMTLQVILTEADIRKVKLTSKPGSVEELISCLKKHSETGLQFNFTVSRSRV